MRAKGVQSADAAARPSSKRPEDAGKQKREGTISAVASSEKVFIALNMVLPGSGSSSGSKVRLKMDVGFATHRDILACKVAGYS